MGTMRGGEGVIFYRELYLSLGLLFMVDGALLSILDDMLYVVVFVAGVLIFAMGCLWPDCGDMRCEEVEE